MSGNSWIWWVLGALLLAIIGFAISAMGKSRPEARRHEASAIRDDSVDHEREMRAREDAAAESDAAARRAQAEADWRDPGQGGHPTAASLHLVRPRRVTLGVIAPSMAPHSPVGAASPT